MLDGRETERDTTVHYSIYTYLLTPPDPVAPLRLMEENWASNWSVSFWSTSIALPNNPR